MILPEKKELEQEILPYISAQLRGALTRLPPHCWGDMEEIRLGVQRPVTVYRAQSSFFLMPDGGQTQCAERALICSKEALDETLSLLTKNSLYACAEQLKNGFLTLPHGHRAGIVGTAVTENGEVVHIKEISGINVRVRRQVKGIAQSVMNDIVTPDGCIRNTLIVSPPQCGKTTLLRDIARALGQSRRVGLVDERGEIAAVFDGVAQNDVGVRTEVLSGCPKSTGVMLLIRSMSPEVILTDELGQERDAAAMRTAISCGVRVIATAHGDNLEDLRRRSVFADLLPVFDRVIILSRRNGAGTIEHIMRRECDDF